MAFAKSILPILTGLFAKRGERAGQGSLTHLLHFATATVKHEISGLVLKISLALVATGVLIFSLIMIGQHVNNAFKIYENGPLLSVIFFTVVSVICVAGLFLLFKEKNPPPQALDSFSSESKFHHAAENIIKNFMEGLHSGLEAKSETKPEKIIVFDDENEKDLREINIEDYKYSELAH